MRFAAFWRAICGLSQRRLRPFAKPLHYKAHATGRRQQSGTLHLAAYPLHYHRHGVALLLSRKLPPGGYAVPLGQASAATAARGVLRYEDGMAAHGCLPTVVWRRGRREASAHEVASVAAYGGHALDVDILHVFRLQAELAAERRPRQPLEQVVEIIFRRFTRTFCTTEVLIGEQVAYETAPVIACFLHFQIIINTYLQSKSFQMEKPNGIAKSDINAP